MPQRVWAMFAWRCWIGGQGAAWSPRTSFNLRWFLSLQPAGGFGRAWPSQTLPGGVGGNLVPPWSRETVMRMAHHAAMHMAWERGCPAGIAAPRAR